MDDVIGGSANHCNHTFIRDQLADIMTVWDAVQSPPRTVRLRARAANERNNNRDLTSLENEMSTEEIALAPQGEFVVQRMSIVNRNTVGMTALGPPSEEDPNTARSARVS